ncbi:uncharacterized protein LOC133800699 [Humulus lupulus]|uniref:uncharacterized protein LOC133800699 n=1 Tax=Humulus lupulus TaxID=3486 RepID=UPI002B40B105|nr:uncharacterized protein LOC133800699 [Humulus lupulus]
MAENSPSFTEKIIRAATVVAKAVPFVIFGAAAFAVITSWKAKKTPIYKRSTSLALLHGGELALKRLVEYHEARVDVNKLGSADCELKLKILDKMPNFSELGGVISKLEMKGREDNAITILKEELQKAQADKRMHEAYEIEMLLVEMLIYKGDYEAAKCCKCLCDENVTDARRPLYLAIIAMASEPPKKEEAERYWKKFVELKTEFSFQPMFRESMEESGIIKISTCFEEFQKVVKKLVQDINKARLRNKTNFKN